MATTRYKTVKDHADVGLVGVRVDIEKTDSSISTITITDLVKGADGKPPAQLVLRVKEYSVAVMVPAPDPTEERFRLAFDLKGLAVDELYATEDLAKLRWQDLTGTPEAYPPAGAVTKVQVPEGTPVSDKADHLPPF
jgi:hypothetical protein